MRIHSISKTKKTVRSYRPPSVTFAGGLVLVQGLGFLGAGLLRFFVYGWGDQGWVFLASLSTQGPQYLIFSGVVWTALGLLAMISALALWQLRSWAWVAGMTLQMMALTSALVSYLRGSPNYLAMLLGAVIVFSLNQSEVQDAFRN